MLFLYNILLWAAVPFIVLYYGAKMLIRGKYRQGLRQRFGLFPPGALEGMQGSPRIWIHAVSVGEVTAAAPIVASLRGMMPDACIVFSTTTETGQQMARKVAPAASAFAYYPLDIASVARRVLALVDPDVFVPVETELWPNFIHACRVKGVKIVMVNGRLSPRSYRRYLRTRFFWEKILAAVSEVGAISGGDAARFLDLGLTNERVHVFGNAKYDGLASETSESLREETGRRLNMAPGEAVLVAGSTHAGEEDIIFRVYKRLLQDRPAFKLIIAPRHVERAESVAEMARERGFGDVIALSEIARGRSRKDEPIVVVDVIGELFKLYSLGTLVFCGGSLVPKGGQNILEAAAWGKVVFYGPFMDDFAEERALLEAAGAGVTVKDGDALLAGIMDILSRPAELKRLGEEGKRFVAAHRGAAARYAKLIEKALSDPYPAFKGVDRKR